MVLLVYTVLLLLSTFLSSLCNGTWTASIVMYVDRSGKGDHRRIQDAIDAVPFNNSLHVYIMVNCGTYKEKIVVPPDKAFITLSGIKPGTTIITSNDYGDIFGSPTVTVLASDLIGRYLTIQNTHGLGDKAVALRVSADRVSFFSCRILSHQDTVLDDTGRHYYRNCYIEGDTDFICGNAASVFKKCHLHSVSQGNGAITAQRRQSPAQETGFMFVGCKVSGAKSALLGRPWGAYSRVVFALCYMSNVIMPQGWDDWGTSSKQRTVFYGEYKCYGPGARSCKRVQWSHSLTTQEAAPYLGWGIIDGPSWILSADARIKRISTMISNNLHGVGDCEKNGM